MRKIVLHLSLIICLCMACYGQKRKNNSNWIYVTNSTDNGRPYQWYIHKNRIIVNNKKRIIRTWVKMKSAHFNLSGLPEVEIDELPQSETSPNIVTAIPVEDKEELTLREFNCIENKVRILTEIKYNFGEVVKRYVWPNPEWFFVAPDTLGEKLFLQACRRSK